MIRSPVAARFLLILLFMHSPLSAWTEWYESDESGVTRAPVSEGDLARHDYVLHVERTAGLEVRTLYHLDVPVRRTELEFEGGRLVSRRMYRNDELEATEHLRYWADGSLRLIRRIGDRGTSVEYRYRDGRLTEEWVDAGSSREHLLYDPVGRLEERTRWAGEEIVERETREYWGDGAEDRMRRRVVVSPDGETTYRYDEAGRLLGSSVSRDGALDLQRSRRYEDGLLIEQREEREGVERVVRYEYDDDGILRQERISENGRLIRIVDHLAADRDYTRVERLYRDGAETLRVYFRGEERLLEEMMRDGEVVRTRRFGVEREESR